MNYFELFELPVAHTVDRSLLSRKYFDLQKKHHPDFFTQSGEAAQAEALLQSANINKAFNIFQDKDRTIEYFLQVNNFIEHDEKYNLPPAFLMDMMEINESVEEDEAAVTKKKVADYEYGLSEEIKSLSRSNDEKGIDYTEKYLARLKEYYYKKKYLKRILDRLGD